MDKEGIFIDISISKGNYTADNVEYFTNGNKLNGEVIIRSIKNNCTANGLLLCLKGECLLEETGKECEKIVFLEQSVNKKIQTIEKDGKLIKDITYKVPFNFILPSKCNMMKKEIIEKYKKTKTQTISSFSNNYSYLHDDICYLPPSFAYQISNMSYSPEIEGLTNVVKDIIIQYSIIAILIGTSSIHSINNTTIGGKRKVFKFYPSISTGFPINREDGVKCSIESNIRKVLSFGKTKRIKLEILKRPPYIFGDSQISLHIPTKLTLINPEQDSNYINSKNVNDTKHKDNNNNNNIINNNIINYKQPVIKGISAILFAYTIISLQPIDDILSMSKFSCTEVKELRVAKLYIDWKQEKNCWKNNSINLPIHISCPPTAKPLIPDFIFPFAGRKYKLLLKVETDMGNITLEIPWNFLTKEAIKIQKENEDTINYEPQINLKDFQNNDLHSLDEIFSIYGIDSDSISENPPPYMEVTRPPFF